VNLLTLFAKFIVTERKVGLIYCGLSK